MVHRTFFIQIRYINATAVDTFHSNCILTEIALLVLCISLRTFFYICNILINYRMNHATELLKRSWHTTGRHTYAHMNFTWNPADLSHVEMKYKKMLAHCICLFYFTKKKKKNSDKAIVTTVVQRSVLSCNSWIVNTSLPHLQFAKKNKSSCCFLASTW